MAQDLVDFQDIYTRVCNELGINTDDTTLLNRVKQIINEVYINEIVPFKRWNWLSAHTNLPHAAYLTTGTVAVTQDSATATLSSAPATSKANYLFSINGSNEVYKISAHTAATATLTLEAAFTGDTNATASYKIWTDTLNLPTGCREVIELWHDHRRLPMDPLGLKGFRRVVNENPKLEERPIVYMSYDYFDPSGGLETESDRYRQVKVYPSIFDKATVLHLDYIQEIAALDLTSDEPAMAVEDRIVIVYGALAIAWSAIVRNPEESKRNTELYSNKLMRMSGQVDSGRDLPQLTLDNHYIGQKRQRFASYRGDDE